METLTLMALSHLERDYEEASISTRGHFLERVTNLELQIDFFIAVHFCDTLTKYEEMMGLIPSSRTTFTEKFQIFEVLVDKYMPQKKIKKKKVYAEQLKNIIVYRNIFAHLPLDNSLSA